MPAWTEAEMATLTQMLSEGRSASQISAAMPHHSRSAVCGRINRMGLSKSRPQAKTRDQRNSFRRERQAALAKRQHANRRREQPVAPDGEVVRHVPQIAYQPSKSRRFIDPNCDGEGVLHCMFPLNGFDGPNDADMPVCDNIAQPDSSYCNHHHSICYQPKLTRRPAEPFNQITTDPRRRRAVA